MPPSVIGVLARHAESVDAAVARAFGADDLIKLRGVEVDRRWGAGRWSRHRGLAAFGQCGVDGGRQFHGVAVAADMHVEGRRAAAQQVIVHGGDFEAVLDQLGHHGVDLGFEQHEVAHDHRAVMHRLECGPAAQCQARPNGDAVERHLQVAARKTVAMDVAAHRPTAAERGIDFLPVYGLRLGSSGKGHRCADHE